MNYLLVNKYDINTSMYHISEWQSYELTDGIDKLLLDAYGTLPIFRKAGRTVCVRGILENICIQ